MTQICSDSDYNNLPAIFIGNKRDAECIAELKKHNIHNIINCAYELQNNKQYDEFEYLVIPLKDCSTFEIQYEDFMKAFTFMRVAKTNGHAVLVHCSEGFSRSPTIVIGALMYECKFSLDDANNMVAQKRNIGPNFGFCCILESFFENNNEDLNINKFLENS